MRSWCPRLVQVCLLLSAGCGDTPASAPDLPMRELSSIAPADAGHWARRVAQLETVPAVAGSHSKTTAHAAVMADDSEDSDAFLTAGRLVYRVHFSIPTSFREGHTELQAAAGELQVDVSLDRLRARFVGPGWPIEEGSEVRLRSDLLGVYLFDGRGGRSLGSGQLAGWFEGRETEAVQAHVMLRRDFGGPRADRPIPGELLCALLVEWAHQDREGFMHRCSSGALPPGFRVGPWVGELTAVVPLSLRHRDLRADEAEPPPPVVRRTGALLVEPNAIARLVPLRQLPDEPSTASLHIVNQSDTRAIVLVQGVPVAWVDAGETLAVEGFAPGYYRIGVMRPLGIVRMSPKTVRIPGDLLLKRPPSLLSKQH